MSGCCRGPKTVKKRKVLLDKGEARIFERGRKIRSLQGRIVVVGEAVNAHDPLAVVQQAVDEA